MYTVYIYNIRIDIHGMQDIHMVIYIYMVCTLLYIIYIYTYIIIFANSMFIHIIIYIYTG